MFLSQKIIAVLALAMLPVLTCQAAWMRQEGELTAMVGFNLSDGGSNFDRAGNRFRDNCGTTSTVPLMVEYGQTYYHTLFASSSFSNFSCGAGTVSGINDIDIGVRGRTNLFANDQTWEVAAIIPSYIGPGGGGNQPKHFGIRIGLNSSDRIDTYENFSAGEMTSPNVFSYGVGLKTWTGHIPNELTGYLAWGHLITESVWSKNLGGWSFSARLDATNSLGKEHTVTAGIGVQDRHDKFSLLTGSVALWRNLTPLSGIQFSVNHGLWGKNFGSPLGLHVSYTNSWRD